MASVNSFTAATLADSTSQSVSGITQSAGSNRVIYVGMSWESTSAPETVSNPQWAGIAMETVTDGTTLARDEVGTGFSAWAQWFQIREADLPSDTGTKTFTCTLSGAPGQATGRLLVVQVQDAAQDRNVEDVSVWTTGDHPAYSLTCSDDSVQIGAAVVGESGSFTASSGFTERDDIALETTSTHHCMTQDLATGTTVNAVHTYSAFPFNRGVGVGFSVANAVAEANASGALTLGAATTAGTLESPRNASGAITLDGMTADGSARLLTESSGALTLGAATVAGTLSAPAGLSGALQLGAATVAGTLESPRNLSGDITLGAATVAGTLVGGNLSGALQLGAAMVAGTIVLGESAFASGDMLLGGAEVAGTLTTEHDLSGDVQLGAATVAGSLESPRNLSGDITLGAATVAGTLTSPRNLSGELVLPAAAVAGSLVHVSFLSGALELGAVTVQGELFETIPLPAPPGASVSVSEPVVRVSVGGAQGAVSASSARGRVD